MKLKVSKKTIFLLLTILIIISTLLYLNANVWQISPETIRDYITSLGAFAPLAYVLIYTVRPLILFPASVLSLAGGLLFGPIYGTMLIVIGATGGAVLSFLVARKLGKNIAGKEWTGKAKKLQVQLEQNGFLYVLLIRLIPVFNFDMISYVAGISKVRLRDFFFGTLLGIIPGAFAYSFLGSSFVGGDVTIIIIAISVFILLSVIPVFFRKKLFPNSSK
ncbi:TVP38/TMEM64 family protein [Paenalkalicoccus suaedae]|uniref:TVP38/TMEM64 family membrane protein n=1 Tax=Paenalkalicoccus suaedae TaxID=2592382 RepID=A0A859FK63_9BACI|nr:TVP38/TMEM64 family protein [Paenalkalicoccus suaedae]QKS73193.1 TVP38/TMEM64 family protein [Paenalkalicoccus suaedae]